MSSFVKTHQWHSIESWLVNIWFLMPWLMNNPYNWVAFHPPRKQQIIRVNCRTPPNEKARSGSPVDLDLSASESTMKTFPPGTFSTLNQEGVFTQPAARRPWVFFQRDKVLGLQEATFETHTFSLFKKVCYLDSWWRSTKNDPPKKMGEWENWISVEQASNVLKMIMFEEFP